MTLIKETLQQTDNMYNQIDFNTLEDLKMASNKLFCTFTPYEELDSLIENITTNYNILYNKVFVLELKENQEEVVVTYNVEQGNINNIPDNTILVHRKKESNTLYTINALNQLIKSLNGGFIDTKYRVNWDDYNNSILLTQNHQLRTLNTKIHKILEV